MSSDPGVGKISFLQLCTIFLLANGLLSHVITNPMILNTSGRDGWLVPLASILPMMVWITALFVIMKRSAQSKLQPWLAERTKPWLSWVLVLPVYLHIYLIGALSLIHTGNWTVSNYLPETPRMVLIFVLLAVSCFAAVSGIRAIAIGSGLLLPVVIGLGYFVAISNERVKDYKLLMPMLEHGWDPVWHGMVYACGGFSEFVIILMLQHRLKSPVKWWQLAALLLVTIYIMLGPLLGAITEFGPEEAAKQTESPFEQWRLVKIGAFIEHVDFLSVYQWLSGASVRIGTSLYLLSECMQPGKRKTRRWIIVLAAASYFMLSMIPSSDLAVYQFKFDYFIPGALILEGAMSVAWLLVALFTTPAKGRST